MSSIYDWTIDYLQLLRPKKHNERRIDIGT